MTILNSFQFSQNTHKIIGKASAIIESKIAQDVKIALQNTSVDRKKLDNATKLDAKELWEKEKGGGARKVVFGGVNTHGGVINTGVYQAFENVAKQADDMKTYKDYLDIASMYEELSKTEGLSKGTAQHYRDIVDNIKLYVAQEAGNNSPVNSRLTKSTFLSNVDGQTKGAVSDLILPLTGDYSRAALGLEVLTKNYKDYSIQEMKDVLSSAESKLMEAKAIIGDLYTKESGKVAVYNSKYQSMTESNYDDICYTLADSLVAMGNGNPNGQLHRDFGEIKLNDIMTELQFQERRNDTQLLSKAIESFKDNLGK